MHILRHALVMIDPLITHSVRLSVCILFFSFLLLHLFPMCSKMFYKLFFVLQTFLELYRPCCQAFENFFPVFKGLQQGPSNPQKLVKKDLKK